jgi:hypothetical protein
VQLGAVSKRCHPTNGCTRPPGLSGFGVDLDTLRLLRKRNADILRSLPDELGPRQTAVCHARPERPQAAFVIASSIEAMRRLRYSIRTEIAWRLASWVSRMASQAWFQRKPKAMRTIEKKLECPFSSSTVGNERFIGTMERLTPRDLVKRKAGRPPNRPS